MPERAAQKRIKLFYSYAHEDEELRNKLENHLSVLKRSGVVDEWHDRRIIAGSEWAGQIDKSLDDADVILLLISADFLASDYCYDIEMRRALERHEAGEAVVIPVVLRAVDWSGAPFGKLHALPTDALAVTSWTNIDEGFTVVAKGIRAAVENLRGDPATSDDGSGSTSSSGGGKSVASPTQRGARALDAAVPAKMTVDCAGEVVCMIRTLESEGLRAVLEVSKFYESTPEDVQTEKFEVEFPRGSDGSRAPLSLLLRVTSPGFSPAHQEKRIEIPPVGDSEVFTFLITPKKAGRLPLTVEVCRAEVTLFSTIFRARVSAEAAEPLASVPFEVRSWTWDLRPRIAVPAPPAPSRRTLSGGMGSAPGNYGSSGAAGGAEATATFGPAPSYPQRSAPPRSVPFWRSRTIQAAIMTSFAALTVGFFGMLSYEQGSTTLPSEDPPPVSPGGVYRVRATVLDPSGRPVDEARVWSSLPGEPQKVAGGWELNIPAESRPADGRLTIFAAKDSAFLSVQLTKADSASVSGMVQDAQGNALAGVRVSVIGKPNPVVTDAGGSFVLGDIGAADGETAQLHAEKAGYRSVTQSHMGGDEPAVLVLDAE